MGNLLLIDLKAAERAKKEKELGKIMKTVMEDGRPDAAEKRRRIGRYEILDKKMMSAIAVPTYIFPNNIHIYIYVYRYICFLFEYKMFLVLW